MRISEYLQIGKKLKAARKNAKISQRNMAKELNLTFSTYSNYENGYSEPPMEIILQFCDIIRISVNDLFEMEINEGKTSYVRTFADLIAILIDLDRRGFPIKGNTTYIQQKNQLVAHLNLEIYNAQLATFIPDWNKANEALSSGLMDEDEYNQWLEHTLRVFNVPIEDYLYKK